jgi:hypothetical protein
MDNETPMEWPADLPRIPAASDLGVCQRCEHMWNHSVWVSQDVDHCPPMIWTEETFRGLSEKDSERYRRIVVSGARCCFYEPLTAETAARWRGPGIALRVPIVPEPGE